MAVVSIVWLWMGCRVLYNSNRSNMFLQALAVILPQVSKEFHLESYSSGLMTSSCLIGMTFGGLIWGYISDCFGRYIYSIVHHRRPAYHITLSMTFIFSLAAAFSPNITILCILISLMGVGGIVYIDFLVGGNLPVDGALFLELIPNKDASLLTLCML
jgi:MFS family permease